MFLLGDVPIISRCFGDLFCDCVGTMPGPFSLGLSLFLVTAYVMRFKNNMIANIRSRTLAGHVKLSLLGVVLELSDSNDAAF